MPHLIAPERRHLPADRRVVFLAGSIEMGIAQDWQARLAAAILAVHPDTVVANPRRTQWDASWDQSIDNPAFAEQVNWELDHLERADLVVFYFEPGTRSPITLLELGKHLERADAPASTLVCCPAGYWRKGNVDIACQRKGVAPPCLTLDELVLHTLRCLGLMHSDVSGAS